MDTMSAFAMGQANRHKELMVLDWEKAAKMIKDRDAKDASAGLAGDWEWTGGDILVDGKIPEDSSPYLASTWATPEIEIGGLKHDCYKMQSKTPGWDADTFWPEEARKILGL